MKKKFFLSVVCMMFALMSVFSLSACGDKNKECSHTYGDWTVVKEATCETKGEKKHTCSKCDKTVSEEIAALGHDWEEVSYVWAEDNSTCTASRICLRDETHAVNETKEATHQTTLPETCVAVGTETYSVEFETAGFETQTKTTERAALGHNNVVEYSYSANYLQGTATYGCDRIGCGHVEYTETVNSAAPVLTPATCDVAGNAKYVYDFTRTAFVDQTKNVVIDALGHNYEVSYDFAADYANCTATQFCTRTDCGHIEVQETKATSTPVVVESTCKTAGSTTYSYAFANSAFGTVPKVVEMPLLDHDYEVTYTYALDYSTCEAKQVCKRDYCKHVGAQETKATETPVLIDVTCTQDGYARYVYNFVNDVFEDQTKEETKEALGHNMGPVEIVWELAYTKCTATIECNRYGCDHEESECLEDLEPQTIRDASCLAACKKQTTADFVNEKFGVQLSPEFIVGDPLGHEMVEDLDNSVAKTCTVDGVAATKCSREGCLHKETTTIPAGHEWDRERTCELGHTCTAGCGSSEPALGHQYSTEPTTTVNADCENPGYRRYECDNCDAFYDEVIDPLGHTLAAEVRYEELKEGETCIYIQYHYCSGCHQDVAAEGEVVRHTAIAVITAHATCQAEGTQQFKCSLCDTPVIPSDLSDLTIPVNPEAHAWVAETGEGYTHKCSICEVTKNVQGNGTLTSHSVSQGSVTGTTEVALENIAIKFNESTISGAKGDITVSANALDYGEKDTIITNLLNSGDAELEALANKIGGSTIYDFGMVDSLGNNLLAKDAGKEAVVKLKYNLSVGEDPNGIVVWFIPEGGDYPESYPAVYTYENGQGYVTFTATHFSRYAMSAMSPEEICEKFNHYYTHYQVEATCTEAGYIKDVCQRCGKVQFENIPARGHSFSAYSVVEEECVAATCVTDGREVRECQHGDCDARQTIFIPAHGHSYEVLAGATSATCQSTGNCTYVCSICDEGTNGHSYTITSGKLPHSYTKTVVKADCLHGGYTEYVCSTCESGEGHSYRENETDPLGHSIKSTYVDHKHNGGVFTVGYTHEWCERCDYENNTSDAEIVHRWLVETPDCLNAKECLICGYVAEEVNEDAHSYKPGTEICQICGQGCEHEFGAELREEATCTENGCIYKVCEKCEFVEVVELLEATGHKGEVSCLVCGYSEIETENFFANALDYMINGNYAFVVDKIEVEQTEYDFGTVVDFEFAEIYFTFDDNGKIFAYGNMSFAVVLSEGGIPATAHYVGTAVIRDDTIYAEIAMDMIQSNSYYEDFSLDTTVDSNQKYTVVATFEELEVMTADEETGETVPLQIIADVLGTQLVPAVKGFVNTNQNMKQIAKLVKVFANDLFSVEATEGGYVLTLDPAKISMLNHDLANMTIAEFIDSRFRTIINDLTQKEGNGFDNLADAILTICTGDTTVDEVFVWLEERGIDLMGILEFASSFAPPAEEEQEGGIADMLEMFQQFREEEVPVKTVLEMFLEAEEEIDLEEMINEYIDGFRQMSIYDFVSGMIYEITGEEISNEDVANMLDGFIYGFSEMLNLELEFGSTGKMTGFGFDFVFATEESDEETAMNLSIAIEISIVEDYISNVDYVSFVKRLKADKDAMRFSKEFLTKVGLYDVEINEYFVFDENNYLVSLTLDFDGMTRIIDFSKVTYLKTSGCGNNSSIVLYVNGMIDGYLVPCRILCLYNERTKEITAFICNETKTMWASSKAVPEHMYGEPIMIREPETCGDIGEYWQVCSVCNHVIVTYYKLPHNLQYDVVCFGDKCSDGVMMTISCEDCGIRRVEIFDEDSDIQFIGRHVYYPVYRSLSGALKLEKCACGDQYIIATNEDMGEIEHEHLDTFGDYDAIYQQTNDDLRIIQYVKERDSEFACSRIQEEKLEIYVMNENFEFVLVETFEQTNYICDNEHMSYFVEFKNGYDCSEGAIIYAICDICGRETSSDYDEHVQFYIRKHFELDNENHPGYNETESATITFDVYCPCSGGHRLDSISSGYLEGYYAMGGGMIVKNQGEDNEAYEAITLYYSENESYNRTLAVSEVFTETDEYGYTTVYVNVYEVTEVVWSDPDPMTDDCWIIEIVTGDEWTIELYSYETDVEMAG